MTAKKRPGQLAGESAMEYLRRAVGKLDYETCSLLGTLPSVDAVLDFFDLWHNYGTDMWAGVMDCIVDGESPDPAIAFVKKYKLPKAWMQDIRDAVAIAAKGQTP